MRIEREGATRVRDAQSTQHVRGSLGHAGTAAPVQAEHFRDLVPDREDGVQCRHRILQDQCDVTAAEAAHLMLRFREQVLAAEQHPPAHDAGGGLRVKAKDREAGLVALARAELAHEAEGLTRRAR